MKLPLSNHPKPALLSDEDSELAQYAWYFTKGYAKAFIPEINKPMHLHKMVMLRQGLLSTRKTPIEHLNGKPLDCRRENLIISTQSANCIRAFPDAGVYWKPACNAYQVSVTYQRHQIYLGLVPSKELASSLASLARERLLQLIAENEQLTLNQVKHFFKRK